ncbi:hypothetical protein N7519_001622 [Penicillium mononematosum]|uniref:uncharacterized protein n=1 Tax=Penicillium mononematosum TaxID=268346 RepID=UPI002549AD71|nr:uncharacterized protein N7519_001622 [Penicillium mononematosum]KAJ6191601.1 hypothetical protein N7519_001622 [Penicillium mononematosum]
MDPFAQLPSELNQQILIHIDFTTAENLISASSHIRAVFRAHPAVINNLILANPITSFPEIRRLCYAIIHTHSRQAREGTPNLDVSIGIIHLVAGIQRLACACLSLMQQSFDSTLSEISAGSLSGPERAEKARKPFSWTEEYRTYWSLFHLQYYSALRKAEPTEALDAYNVWNEIGSKRAEQIWTIAAILSDLGLTPSYSEGAEPLRAAWDLPEETALPFFHSFNLPPSSEPVFIWSPPPIPPENETPTSKCWQLSSQCRSRVPLHIGSFHRRSRWASQRRYSVLGLSLFRPWRRLGIVIWDSWRMCTVGLFNFHFTNPWLYPPNPDGSVREGEHVEPDLTASLLALVGEEFRA